MNTFFRFLYEFISIFIEGISVAIKGIINGITQILNFDEYQQIINSYKSSFQGFEWILVGTSIAFLVIIVGLIILLIFFRFRKFFRLRRNKLNQEDMLDEIADLNQKVKKLMKEKDEIMAMKVSKLGLSPEDDDEELEVLEDDEEEAERDLSNIRFPKLERIDQEFKNFKPRNYGNTFTLEELVDNFRSYSASQLKLYYDTSLLRAFVGGLACGKLIILQGISGTGKTSLAYAWGKFVKQDSCIASVEPSWRDKTEFLGYFNEFTKRFNETDVLAELYISGLDDDIHTIILDEMNIARVEYYFAEMLSILEMPSRDEWIVELVTSPWPEDPKRIISGKLKLPGNLWYIGTINNDDSTFMVTDKVYDRAMPIDINNRIDPFKSRDQEAMEINSSYLEALFEKAEEDFPVSEKNLLKVKEMDDYVIKHFRIAFGNRIMKQLNTFVPVYVACGGKEIEGIDYFISKKIFRKFEQLNVAFIRDEIDPFIEYLNKEFGNGTMKEAIEYFERLKKSI
ncbi:MAG: hypothetical protein PHW32_03105 [Bacilli bacterium]|nr:hypothetical protein [Bacilli bacterium]MDD4282589.1 hypothetical protein [Bacilli bacterium]MDD4718702.1 hypothetical protein [Bacilli bacterium]